MFSVIFEVFPYEQRFDEYLALAKHLKPILETIDGFVDNERFESTRRPGWLLSHSTWRDESRWFAGAPRASTTRSRRRAGPRFSATTTCGLAMSPPTPMRRRERRFASSASTRPRSARRSWRR